MINSGKDILKPNIKIGDIFVDTETHTIFKVMGIKLDKSWSRHLVTLEAPLTGEHRVLWLFILAGDNKLHKL